MVYGRTDGKWLKFMALQAKSMLKPMSVISGNKEKHPTYEKTP